MLTDGNGDGNERWDGKGKYFEAVIARTRQMRKRKWNTTYLFSSLGEK